MLWNKHQYSCIENFSFIKEYKEQDSTIDECLSAARNVFTCTCSGVFKKHTANVLDRLLVLFKHIDSSFCSWRILTVLRVPKADVTSVSLGYKRANSPTRKEKRGGGSVLRLGMYCFFSLFLAVFLYLAGSAGYIINFYT
jgi:hypothetical protein